MLLNLFKIKNIFLLKGSLSLVDFNNLAGCKASNFL